MSNYIRVAGTHAEFDIEINIAIRDEDFDNPDFIVGTAAKLHEWGLTPKSPPAVTATPAAARAQASGYGQQPQGPSQQASQSGGCPVHGLQFTKQGYQGRGWECSAFSENGPTDWTKDRASAGRNGNPDRYYCKFKW